MLLVFLCFLKSFLNAAYSKGYSLEVILLK